MRMLLELGTSLSLLLRVRQNGNFEKGNLCVPSLQEVTQKLHIPFSSHSLSLILSLKARPLLSSHPLSSLIRKPRMELARNFRYYLGNKELVQG